MSKKDTETFLKEKINNMNNEVVIVGDPSDGLTPVQHESDKVVIICTEPETATKIEEITNKENVDVVISGGRNAIPINLDILHVSVKDTLLRSHSFLNRDTFGRGKGKKKNKWKSPYYPK